MEIEILRLFKGYLGEKSTSINIEALKYGLVIPSTANEKVVNSAIKMYGKNGKEWNMTLHKDFSTVKNSSLEDLIIQQILHYITTYGFESLGLYSNDTIYIPAEELEIPDLELDKIELINIKALSEYDLKEKIMKLINSGIALSKQSVQDVLNLSDFIDKNKFDEIKNREIKIALYDKYGITPINPDEFLRYLIFKLTGETLKIQSEDMINKIKKGDKNLTLKLLNTYLYNNKSSCMINNGLIKLSSIFLRNKKIFLAFKVHKDNMMYKTNVRKELNLLINKIRRLSKKYHKPLIKNNLDNLTNPSAEINIEDILLDLNNITIFRETTILNGILYRLYGNDDILYKIRNGKTYVTKIKEYDEKYKNRLEFLYKQIFNHYIKRLEKKVKGKTIYIPKNVIYAMPTSEKQFNDNIPFGSYVEMPRDCDLIYGIHWVNLPRDKKYDKFNNNIDERVDLDLKQMNGDSIFGWDADYKDDDLGVFFSGDVTSAPLPNGATELFYVKQNVEKCAYLVTLNSFTSNSKDVPFEFVIAKSDKNNDLDKENKYVINPNNILLKTNMEIKKSIGQKTIGLIEIDNNIRFYFNDFGVKNSYCNNFYIGNIVSSCRTSSINEATMGAFSYLKTYNKLQLKLNDVLEKAGAILSDSDKINVVIREADDFGNIITSIRKEDVDFNLSLENITKDSIINLIGE